MKAKLKKEKKKAQAKKTAPKKTEKKSTAKTKNTKTGKTVAKTTSQKKTATKKAQTKKSTQNVATKIQVVIEKRDEFRMHKTKGHPAYIFEKVGKKYKFLGVTKAPFTNGVKNIELDVNPEPGNNAKAHVRPMVRKDKVKNFKTNKLEGWEMSSTDKEKIKPLTNK